MADLSAFDTLNRALVEMQANVEALGDNLRQLNTQGIAPFNAGDRQAAGMESLFAGRATAAGNGSMNIIIQNNSSAAVSARQVDDGFDQKSLEITIDQMVANSLLRGRETTGVLRSLFNLVPVLMGR